MTTTTTQLATIDLDLLTNVTGGARPQTGAPQQPQQGDAQDGAQQSAGGGFGSFLSGLDGFLSFLQTPQFGKIVGGLQGLLQTFFSGGSSGASNGQPQADSAQQG